MATSRRIDAVLCDRDGTLVVDVPFNDDPSRVIPLPGVTAGLARLREAGLPVGILADQGEVARGLVTPGQVDAVNRRVADVLGTFQTIAWCPHAPRDRCGCGKPAPGLIVRAATALGVTPDRCAVIGDEPADVEAAHATGALGILVPRATAARTAAPWPARTVSDFAAAADLVLAGDAALRGRSGMRAPASGRVRPSPAGRAR
jgi:histidinol-phosphate phosphatase family protein